MHSQLEFQINVSIGFCRNNLEVGDRAHLFRKRGRFESSEVRNCGFSEAVFSEVTVTLHIDLHQLLHLQKRFGRFDIRERLFNWGGIHSLAVLCQDLGLINIALVVVWGAVEMTTVLSGGSSCRGHHAGYATG